MLGLLKELLQTWHSFGKPRYPIGLFWYYSSDCHTKAGLGISLWDTHELSICDHTGALLQYAQFWLFYTLFYYSCTRYPYCSYSRAYLQGTTCFEGIASWLPQMPMSKDELLSLFYKTPSSWGDCQNMLGFCKSSKVPEYGDDICSPSLVSL